MAKKTSRRNRRRSTPNVPSYTAPVRPAAERAEPSSVARLYTGAVSSPKQVDFRSEYRYVLTDLRNMLLLSLVMVLLLVALNFLL